MTCRVSASSTAPVRRSRKTGPELLRKNRLHADRHVALGYFNDPERTSETFREDGWLFSGDLATIDELGYVKLIGRKKEIVNRGGLKISVREVEEMLLAHGAFSMVALVAVPDSRLREKGCLFVWRPGQSSSLADVVGFLESRGVAKYKLSEFPMTASGKIQKFQLRDEFLAGKHADATDGRSAVPKFQKQESRHADRFACPVVQFHPGAGVLHLAARRLQPACDAPDAGEHRGKLDPAHRRGNRGRRPQAEPCGQRPQRHVHRGQRL
ncbi:hypothetical protein CDZ98_17760 [Mameliella alba]|nr:hypothetical protein CDZ98_17760 [Mameliella alba]